LHGAVFGICAENSTDNTGVFHSLLSSARTASPGPVSERAGGAQGAGRGHSQDSWPQLTQGCPRPEDVVLSNESWGRRRKGGCSG